MKKVLHVLRGFYNGGTEKYVMDLLRSTYKDYENILLVYENINHYKEELDKMNIKIIVIEPPKKIGFSKSIKKIRSVIKENDVDIVYSYTHYNSSIVMLCAFLEHVKIRITHSHRSSSEQSINPIYLMYILFNKILINIFSNVRLACGKKAGKSLFYKKFTIINNGVDIDKFKYDIDQRNQIRKKLNVSSDCSVIGMIGRLDINKNNIFFIKVFENYLKINSNSKLIIVGDGDQKEKLTKYVNDKKLNEKVLFLGKRDDVNKLYSAFDLFALTSIKEGLPYVLIEAQTNGLRCLVSDSVDRESNVSQKCTYLSLSDDYEKWCNEIDKNIKKRDNNIENLISNGYSLTDSVKEVINIYEINN